MKFDTTNPWVRWMLHVYNNRRHDGEIWLAVHQKGRMFLVEQSKCPDDADVLGEVRTRLVAGESIHDIVPLQQRSAEESRRMRQQAEEHKAYRAELYKRYSFRERLADLSGKNLAKVKQDKPN
jgi:hypothetical protein